MSLLEKSTQEMTLQNTTSMTSFPLGQSTLNDTPLRETVSGVSFSNWSNLESARQFYYPGEHGVVPTAVFVGVLAVVGCFGNLQVLIVSFLEYKAKCTYITYVRALAVIDFLTCVLHMPAEFLDLYYPYDFFSAWTCRIFRFNNSFLFLTSSFILLAIAIDRYRHVCYPFRIQRTVSTARKFIALCACCAFVLSCPLFVIYGPHRVEVDYGIFAKECYVNDTFLGTIYPLVYTGLLYLIVVIVAIILIYTYASIGITLRSQERRRVTLMNKDACECHFRSECRRPSYSKQIWTTVTHQLSNESEERPASQKNSQRKQKKSASRRFEIRKYTKILFLITLIFILTYLPFVSLSCVALTHPNLKKSLNDLEISLYEIAMRLTLLNNVSNPFVYGIFDDRFKIASRKLCSKCCFLCTRKKESMISYRF